VVAEREGKVAGLPSTVVEFNQTNYRYICMDTGIQTQGCEHRTFSLLAIPAGMIVLKVLLKILV